MNFPKKRVLPISKIDLSNKVDVIEKNKMQILSKEMGLRDISTTKEDFAKVMEPHLEKIIFYKKVYRWSMLPKGVARKIIKLTIGRK